MVQGKALLFFPAFADGTPDPRTVILHLSVPDHDLNVFCLLLHINTYTDSAKSVRNRAWLFAVGGACMPARLYDIAA